MSDVEGVDPVDEGVVRLGHDREAAVVQALDEVDLPQRPGAVELARLHPGHEVLQLLVAARARQAGPAHVVAHVEGLVVDPHGVGDATGHVTHLLAEARDRPDAALDDVDELVVVEAVARAAGRP